jgi:hypothetical protein
MSEHKTSVQIGPSGPILLTIVFVLLKVYEKIDWSWWWVFSPLWIGAALALLFMAFVVAIAVIAGISENK